MDGISSELRLNEAVLNALGQEQWEAVSWWHNPNYPKDEDGMDTFVLFKRPNSK